MGKQNKEIIVNMEFLMKDLHKEWDRTGAAKASVFIVWQSSNKPPAMQVSPQPL
jgi:hypothetical protein